MLSIHALSIPIKHPTEVLEKEINSLLEEISLSDKSFNELFEFYLPQWFSLRIKILSFFIKEGFDLNEILNYLRDILPEIKEKLTKKAHHLLAENFEFAINLSVDVSLSILESHLSESEIAAENLEFLSDLSFEKFKFLINIEGIPLQEKSYIIELTKTVIYLELALLLTYFYAEEKITLTEIKERELCIYLRDTVQLYGALAMELNLWQVGLPLLAESKVEISEEDLKEEKLLAEMGLEDYLKNILKDEE